MKRAEDVGEVMTKIIVEWYYFYCKTIFISNSQLHSTVRKGSLSISWKISASLYYVGIISFQCYDAN